MRRVILDTDGGVDDALAMLYLLDAPAVSIEAITTVNGNVPVDIATRNVFEVLRVGRYIGPLTIARGCDAPLCAPATLASHVHGDDGLGGWTTGKDLRAGELVDVAAPKLILDVARRYPGQVTLITIGPLTNAAVALRTDSAAFRSLKNVVIMGGSIGFPGNVTPTAEYNVYADAEAARDVLRSAVPITLVGLNVTMQVAVTREMLDQDVAGRDDERADFLRCILAQIFCFYRNRTGDEICYLHDPLAVGVALDPAIVRTRGLAVDVETKGELTRGMTVADLRAGRTGPIEVCVEVDRAAFLDEFRENVLRKL